MRAAVSKFTQRRSVRREVDALPISTARHNVAGKRVAVDGVREASGGIGIGRVDRENREGEMGLAV